MNDVLLGFCVLFVFYSCSDHRTQEDGSANIDSNKEPISQSGLIIESGINRGITLNDSQGIHAFLIHTESTITNDSTIPIHIEIEIAREFDFPSHCENKPVRVMLLPDLTSSYISLYDSITKSFDDFVNACLETPTGFKRTLNAGEQCQVTLGALHSEGTNCGVYLRTLFAHENRAEYKAWGQVNDTGSVNPHFELNMELGYYSDNRFGGQPDSCALIRCGQISYPGL